MVSNKALMKSLEKSNWNEADSKFHIFNTQEELNCYLSRSEDGKWWREDKGRFDFEQCVFNFDINSWVNIFHSTACFKNAEFIGKANFRKATFKENVDFSGCRFSQHVNFLECTFEKEFYPCSFDNSVNFESTKFNKYVDFVGISFFKYVNFSQSKFDEGVSFNDSIFYEEVRFHNSKIEGDAFFIGTEFKGKVNSWELECFKDINFEWANFRDKCNFSELKASNGFVNLHGVNFEKNAYFYNSDIKQLDLTKSVIDKGVFFLNAKISELNRETARIIKHEFIKQNNKIESLKYHSLEMEEYEKELFGVNKHIKYSFVRFFRDFFCVFKKSKGKDERTNRFVIFINRISNGFNLLPFRGVCFTLIATLVVYLLLILAIKINLNLELEFSSKFLDQNIKDLFKLLNVTDWRYNPLNIEEEYTWPYAILFIGRIIIGFGIYQTIQAFRKFGSV